MTIAAKVMIALWFKVSPDVFDELMEWHPREHMPERLALPGFMRGRLYTAAQAGAEFFVTYEVESSEALTSQGYVDLTRNPTPWTVKMMPALRDHVRGACRVLSSDSVAMGGLALAIRIAPQPGARAKLVAALVRSVLPGLVARAAVTGVHLLENDERLSNNQLLRPQDRVEEPDLVLLLEGSSEEGLLAAAQAALSSRVLASANCRTSAGQGAYRLAFSVQNLARAD